MLAISAPAACITVTGTVQFNHLILTGVTYNLLFLFCDNYSKLKSYLGPRDPIVITICLVYAEDAVVLAPFQNSDHLQERGVW